MESVQLAEYENGVTNRQAKEKEITAGLHTEMRVTELTVRGLKRKAFRKETAGEKADRDRREKKALIDSLWQAGARKEKEKGTTTTANRKEDKLEEKSLKAKPGPNKIGQNPNKVQLAKSKGSALAS